MRVITFILILSSIILSSNSSAQSSHILIGEIAPGLHPEAWVQGPNLSEFHRGQVYVISFWNRQFSPFVPALPHLTGKMLVNTQFVSVNTLDHLPRSNGDESDSQMDRVERAVKKRRPLYPFSICVDDKNDSIAKQWQLGEDAQSVPRVAIVDQLGRVAWMGNPMSMEWPLIAICRNKYDVTHFKGVYEERQSSHVAERQILSDIEQSAKAGDKILTEGLIDKLSEHGTMAVAYGIYHATMGSPEIGLETLKDNINKNDAVYTQTWCGLLAHIAENSKLENTKQEAVRISKSCVNYASNPEKLVVLAIHSEVLASAGRMDEAKTALAKATAMLQKYHPIRFRPQMSQYLEEVRAKITRS